MSANPSGVNIDIVDKKFNNTQFQCYLPNDTGLFVHKSTIGNLSVTKVGKSYDYDIVPIYTVGFEYVIQVAIIHHKPHY